MRDQCLGESAAKEVIKPITLEVGRVIVSTGPELIKLSDIKKCFEDEKINSTLKSFNKKERLNLKKEIIEVFNYSPVEQGDANSGKNNKVKIISQDHLPLNIFVMGGRKQPMVITVNDDTTYQVLFDSGADFNLVSDRITPKNLIKTNIGSVQLACNDIKAKVLGKCNLKIKLGDRFYTTEFWMIENLDTDFILGTPFMEKEEVIIDYPRRCIYLGKEVRHTLYWQPKEYLNNNEVELPVLEHDHPVELKKLINNFQTLFQTGLVQPTTRTTTHKIELTQNKIINRRCYPTTPRKKEILYDQLEEMLSKGVIEPTNSPYASPPVLVERSGKDARFCVDFRELNHITSDESSSLPRVTDALKDISTCKYFSVLDLKKGYWQIPLAAESKKYTAFNTPDGAAYHFNVMPFGLKNAPSTFQKMMTTEVLVGFIQKFVIVYLDDIIIYSKTKDEHLKHLNLVFERLQMHNLKVSGKKCQLLTTELDYLGHHIRGDVVEPQNKHKIDIKNFAIPNSKKQVQSFIGLCNWLREYIPNLAELAAPLTDLLKNKRNFKWGEIETKAFNNIKLAIENCHPLHRPNFELPFCVQTDSSSIGMSAMLYQEVNGSRHIIEYASAKFNNTVKNYHINEQECLAIIWALQIFGAYVQCSKFVLRTDSKALTWLSKFKDTRAKLTRWALQLQEYNFDIEHIPGRSNEFCDYLSRNPEENIKFSEVPDNDRLIPPDNTPKINIVTIGDLHKLILDKQKTTPYIQNTINILKLFENQPPEGAAQRKLARNFNIKDNLLWRRCAGGDRIVVPSRIKDRVIYMHHDLTEAAHPGVDETYRKITEKYYWGHQRESIANYIRNCSICHLCRQNQRQVKAPLRAHSPKYPFQTLSMDVLGPYTPSAYKTRKQYILVVEDIFSKWVEAKAYTSVKSPDVVKFLETEIIPRYGVPENIITDQGPCFKGNALKNFCEKQGIKQNFSAVYHQQANPVERKVQELKKVLSVLLFGKKLNLWEELLPKALQVLRSRFCRATGATPASIILGYELPVPGEWEIQWPRERKNLTRKNRRRRNKEIAQRQKDYQIKEYHDMAEPRIKFRVGDKVNIKDRRAGRAFAPYWSGPHEVVERVSDTTYDLLVHGKQINFHVDDIRPSPEGNNIDIDNDDDLTSESDISEYAFPRNLDRVNEDSDSSEDISENIELNQVEDEPSLRERQRLVSEAEIPRVVDETNEISVLHVSDEDSIQTSNQDLLDQLDRDQAIRVVHKGPVVYKSRVFFNSNF